MIIFTVLLFFLIVHQVDCNVLLLSLLFFSFQIINCHSDVNFISDKVEGWVRHNSSGGAYLIEQDYDRVYFCVVLKLPICFNPIACV